ncbi:hypothetical protein FGIG_00396 [Fasciola gigantica]|uniref:Uncharacterized protein n=1 Tax=Fasciola gigantica TaxID=46835 RepID=A0A504YI58_FASGI|nr:hypothetical protein FGIG_00396 [Fasciola gigantica]
MVSFTCPNTKPCWVFLNRNDLISSGEKRGEISLSSLSSINIPVEVASSKPHPYESATSAHHFSQRFMKVIRNYYMRHKMSKIRVKLARRCIGEMKKPGCLRVRVASCFVAVEPLQSIPVKDARFIVKPCSIRCDLHNAFPVAEVNPNEHLQPEIFELGPCAIDLPFLPLPLSDYVHPKPSLVYDHCELLKQDRSR